MKSEKRHAAFATKTRNLLLGVLILLLAVSFALFFLELSLFRAQRRLFPLMLAALPALLSLVCLVLGIRWCLLPYRYYEKLFSRALIQADPEVLLRALARGFPNLDTLFLRIDQALDAEKSIELSTKQAEFLTLQSQINPHFLYNTLDSIRGDALAGGNHEIADVAEALSTYFRYTISEKRPVVPLHSELQNVQNYFKVQQYRFGSTLTLKLDITNENTPDGPAIDIMEAECPKLILQPVVENAILHGLNTRTDDRRITIRAFTEPGQLRIRITDNGRGMTEAELNKIRSSFTDAGDLRQTAAPSGSSGRTGIALKNINRRIRLLYGENYGLQIYSIPGTGTDVHIRLPLKKAESQNEKDIIIH